MSATQSATPAGNIKRRRRRTEESEDDEGSRVKRPRSGLQYQCPPCDRCYRQHRVCDRGLPSCWECIKHDFLCVFNTPMRTLKPPHVPAKWPKIPAEDQENATSPQQNRSPSVEMTELLHDTHLQQGQQGIQQPEEVGEDTRLQQEQQGIQQTNEVVEDGPNSKDEGGVGRLYRETFERNDARMQELEEINARLLEQLKKLTRDTKRNEARLKHLEKSNDELQKQIEKLKQDDEREEAQLKDVEKSNIELQEQLTKLQHENEELRQDNNELAKQLLSLK